MRTSIPTTETESLIRIALGRRGIRGVRLSLRKQRAVPTRRCVPALAAGAKRLRDAHLTGGGPNLCLRFGPASGGKRQPRTRLPDIIAEPCIGFQGRVRRDVGPADRSVAGEGPLYIHPEE